MTVNELIEELRKYRGDMVCRIGLPGDHGMDAYIVKGLLRRVIPEDEFIALLPDFDNCI